MSARRRSKQRPTMQKLKEGSRELRWQTPQEQQPRNPIPKKWIFLGLSLAALIPLGNIAEYVDSNSSIQPTPEQNRELTMQHQHILEKLGNLSVDESGAFRGKAVFSPSTSDSMELTLHLEDDSLVVQSKGQHSGITENLKRPYTDPYDFTLTYSVAGLNAQSAPDALQKIREMPQHMPEELTYSYSKIRRNDYGTLTRGTTHIKKHVDFNLEENGALQTIRVGETPLQGNDAVISHAAITLDLIEHEIDLAASYSPVS